MVRQGKKGRRLGVGDKTFFYSVGHEHDVERTDGQANRYHDCREVVSLRVPGTAGRLLITFRAGEGRLVSDGILPGGAVGTTAGVWLNLHEPGTIRALLDQALAQGWVPGGSTTEQFDGWRFFDAVAARRAGSGAE